MDSMDLIGSNVCFKNTQGDTYTCLFSFKNFVYLFGEKMKPDDISFYTGRDGFVSTDLTIIKIGICTYIHVFHKFLNIKDTFTIQSNEKLQPLIDFLPTLLTKQMPSSSNCPKVVEFIGQTEKETDASRHNVDALRQHEECEEYSYYRTQQCCDVYMKTHEQSWD